ncbi:hypothetical protein EU556_25735 [Hymenobacter fodinae]|uniref:Uncharacterized protein n=1 Tax=Hymenobacter fodinae TaxID=2510796 RepID=A0A4Z0NY93_9BACT|nr:hypothetical protein EU556_25735 [Hymenobacter fodinae]
MNAKRSPGKAIFCGGITHLNSSLEKMKKFHFEGLALLMREARFYAMLLAFFIVVAILAYRPDLLVTILVVGRTFLPKP